MLNHSRPWMTTGLVLASIAPVPASAQQLQCPSAPNQVNATVTASISLDEASGVYTYTYSLRNPFDSAQAVEQLEVYAAAPFGVTAPPGWAGGPAFDLPSVQWLATAPSGAPDEGAPAALGPSTSNIKPGETVAGFSFRSLNPPGAVRFYVYGFAPIGFSFLTPDEYEGALEEFSVQCDNAPAAGATTGPIEPLAVRISVGEPKSGTLTATIHGASDFDVSQIDQASVRLGPGRAAPLKPVTRYRDVDGDKRPDVVLEFNASVTATGCADAQVLLTGRTISTVYFKGSYSRVPTC